MKHVQLGALQAIAVVLIIVFATTLSGQSVPGTQTFRLTGTQDLTLVNVKADAVEYKGRKAVRITKDNSKDGFAVLRGTDFQDGTIEADIAVKITTPPGVRMPGFAGIAFRARPDVSHYELFYLRPKNAHSEDQAMRNHAVQYSAEPDFGWYRLRREWPMLYESNAELKVETWTKLKITVKGRTAKLYLNGSDEPTLIVDGLKGTDLHGAIALWGYDGEEAYFSNLRITHDVPQPVKNGGEATGTWQIHFASDYGVYEGKLQLNRTGSEVTGVWSGALGKNQPVRGTWRDGYVELNFDAEWQGRDGSNPVNVPAMLSGWIDEDAFKGRMSVQGKAEGPFTAKREQ